MVFVADFPASEVLVFTLTNRPRVTANFIAFDFYLIIPGCGTEDAVDLMLQCARLVMIIVTVFERLNVGVCEMMISIGKLPYPF